MYTTVFRNASSSITDDDLFELHLLIANEIRIRYKQRLSPEEPRIAPVSPQQLAVVNNINPDDVINFKNKTENMKAYKRWYYLKPRVAAGQAKEAQIAEFIELDKIFGK